MARPLQACFCNGEEGLQNFLEKESMLDLMSSQFQAKPERGGPEYTKICEIGTLSNAGTSRMEKRILPGCGEPATFQ